ncbi:MAG TPA: bifunctional lysylphosphatidylglycerol flippase/synthetase MprF [Spongiibacteraceae bacterium]
MSESKLRPVLQNLAFNLQRLTPLIGIALFTLALVVVHHEIELYHWSHIKQSLLSLPPLRLLAAFALMLCGYAVLTIYDWLALEYAGQRLPYAKVGMVSFLSYAISNNVGHALISGGSMRYRLYSSWGLSVAAIARALLFLSVTYLIGTAFLLLCSYLALPSHVVLTDKLPAQSIDFIVAIISLALVAWWTAVLFWQGDIHIGGFTLRLPEPYLALRQMLIGVVDLLLASLVLYVPLTAQIDLPYTAFLVLFLLAQLTGLASQVPGGIGVFEGSFLFLIGARFPAAHVLAALIAYRIIYYFLPLACAALWLVLYEVRHSKFLRSPPLRSAFGVVETSIPQVFSLLLLLAGAILLFSGATPGVAERIHWLRFFLPLPIMELSHLVGSIAGLLLLFLARAVRSRIDAAYYAAIALLGVGVAASLMKGFDYEEALILSAMLLVFLPTKRHFYRKSALLQFDLSGEWLVLIGIILVASTWLGFFSYKHIEYSHELWWQFSFHGDASRFLRSLFALCLVVSAFVVYRLMTHIPATLTRPTAEELQRALIIARRARDTAAHLALTGDKYLLWSDSGNSFLMFDITRKFWIAMGDPVGAAEEHVDLVWKLREMADRHGARIAFYQVGTEDLPLYLDMGLALSKLGEEARVDLSTFGLEGKRRANLRHAFSKAQRDGAQFEIFAAPAPEPVLDQIYHVSNVWMMQKQVREKRFSLGFYSRDYLRRCDIAVVRIEGRVVAFANLWQLETKDELSIDLMRYDSDAPNGVMEYLTLSVMLWARAQGYRWFNLGMAPLSGLEQHPLAPMWHKIGNTVFRFGQEFYNFKGLYQYKDKFDPEWRPRYLAAPAGLSTASVLLAVTTLISGGVRGVFTK